MGASSTTTTPTSRIAGRSSIAIVFIRIDRTLIMAPILRAEVVQGRDFTRPTPRTHRQARIPAPSVGSAMEAMREPTHSEDSPDSPASTEEAVSTEGAATAAEATDTLPEAIAP